MEDLVEMGMVDVCKHSEHLLVDALARLLEDLRESALLSDPVLAGLVARKAPGGAGHHRGWGGGGRRGGPAGLGGEQSLVVDAIRNPQEDILDVCGGREAHGLLVRVQPGVVEAARKNCVSARTSGIASCRTPLPDPETYPGPADMDGQFLGVQNSWTTP